MTSAPPPPDEQDQYVQAPRRLRAVLAVLVLVVAGVGAYLFWPAPTLDDQESAPDIGDECVSFKIEEAL
jgi:hypothetical protein